MWRSSLLQDESLLELKVRLELEGSGTKYLLYAPTPEPEPDQDWLLDIRLYSRSFHADQASILLSELGLSHQSMRAHLNERMNFFILMKLFGEICGEEGCDFKAPPRSWTEIEKFGLAFFF